MSDKHEERASKWISSEYGDYDAWWVDTDEHVASLAEQFREVEREAQEEKEKSCSFAVQLATMLYEGINDVPAIETVHDWKEAIAQAIEMLADQKLREVVRAGDALAAYSRDAQKTAAFPFDLTVGAWLAAWDAATKGIERG